MIFKKIIPLSLLGRSIIIIFVPIIVLVIITSIIFYQTSWNIISKRLTESVVADINVLVKLIDKNLEFETMQIAKEDFKMTIKIVESANINKSSYKKQRGILSNRLKQSLVNLNIPFAYDLSNIDDGVKIILQLKKNKYLLINVDKDRLYSETAFVFLLWMIFASILLLFFSYFFMNKQIRPLKRLAIIAETFGRGLDAPILKSSGSIEIRQTANAFNKMSTRIKRFLKQRS